MPRKRKSNLTSPSPKARALKIARRQEAFLQAILRKREQAERQAPLRDAELPSQHQQRIEEEAARQALLRAKHQQKMAADQSGDLNNYAELRPMCTKNNKDELRKRSSTEKPIVQVPSTSEVKTPGAIPENVKNDSEVSEDKKPRINELDKFKRRLIRAIARLMLVEKKPEEEIWKELKKETTCDCKLLWTRMRALTIKKLKRLISANDNNENITKIAQLSVTDWLLYDLVLVHEDVDVIGQDIETDGDKDQKILEDLFQLVLKYNIENLAGDPLTLAWYELTAEYNQRGRKCSPMLLQRRWYQLKKLVRFKFYNFWFEYRGSIKNFQQADKYKPTNLEMDVVKQFMFLVTKPFKSWDKLIGEQKVALPADFERLQLAKKKKANAEDEPDIQLIEPHVETIDLGVESDEDTNDSSKNENLDSNTTDSNDVDTATVIKTESVYDEVDVEEVNVLENVRIPLESDVNVAISNIDEEINASSFEETNIQETQELQDEATHINEVQDVTDIDNEQNDVDHHDDIEHIGNDVDVSDEGDNNIVDSHVEENNDFELVMPKITSVTSTAEIPEIDLSDDTPETNNIVENTDKISQNHLSDTKENSMIEITVDNLSNNMCQEQKEVAVENKHKPSDMDFFDEVPNDLHFIDGIELEDDGIEFVDEEEHMIEPKVEVKDEINETTIIEDDAPDEDTPKIDLKLLLNPVVYTKKLDHMDVFRFIDFITVKDRRVLDSAALESKPVDKKSVKMEEISQESENSWDGDTLDDQASECNSEKEQEVVKSTSWLFRKPRVTLYNPIQLCKNPDFNTRLKRLTAGFFSSQRNRQLLQHCKPLTIDVHKAFECKLVNNSLCLKKSYFSEAKQTESIKTVEKTVLPSELPGQSLNCDSQSIIPLTSIPSTSPVNRTPKDEVAPEVHTIERNKVINLPDIDQIRRNNEKLLIAEVTPLQASNVTNLPPVAIVQAKIIEQNTQQAKPKYDEVDVSKDLHTKNTSISVGDTPETVNKVDSNTNNQTAIRLPTDLNTESLTFYQRMKMLNKIPKPPKTRKIAVTWNPRNIPNFENPIPDDRLLARDTVERIISVCKGINTPTRKKELIKKRKSVKHSCGEVQTANEEVPCNITKEQQQQTTIPKIKSKDVQDKNKETNDNINKNVADPQDKSRANNKLRGRKRKITSCCWAREKLEFWSGNIKRMRLRHTCPQYKCVCCCNVAYCTELKLRRDKNCSVVSYLNLVSDDESDHNSGTLIQAQKPSQNQIENIYPKAKVSIGINTDFDKEFEENYATNINKLNNPHDVPIQPVISCVTSLRNEESYSNGTQTLSCQQIVTGPPSRAIRTSTITLETKIIQDKLINMQPKCKTKISSVGYNQTLIKGQNFLKTKKHEIQAPKVVDIYQNEKAPNKVLILNNNKEVKKKAMIKPICLGKNKILLCSLKPLSKTSMIDVTHLVNNFNPPVTNLCANSEPSQLIPEGVHLVLLPNQELVLSIDPGVELNPTQITHLPAILNSVQKQLFTLGFINKLPLVDGVAAPSNPLAQQIGDVIQLSDDESEHFKAEKNKVVEDVVLRDLEQDICFNKIDKSIASSVEHTSDGSSSIAIPSETSDGPSTNQIINNTKNSTNEINQHTTENTTKSDEAIQDSEINTTSEKVEENIEQNSLPNNSNTDEGVDDSLGLTKKDEDLKETVNTSKKTILSDLMEMSGISLEDTAVTNTEIPVIEPPMLLPVDFPQELHMPRNILPIDYDGKTYDPILINPFLQAALVKCPDLNVLYSFEELKYAYENNAQFYKMDLETGIIVPINVCIRKQNSPAKTNINNLPKSVIDLTEEEVDGQTSVEETKTPEKNIEKDDLPNTVKPIKLIKAIHPSILRHNFKTLIKQQDNKETITIRGSKLRGIRIIGGRRKQDMKSLDKSERSKSIEEEKNVANSDSDDEPLALKAKRIRRNSDETPEDIEMNESQVENNQETEKDQPSEQEMEIDLPDVPVLAEDHPEILEPSLEEPVIFQCNNDESSDEDCILGV